MRVKLTPITRGVERNIDDVAQQPGGLRDSTGLVLATAGRLDGVYRGANRISFNSAKTPTRWAEWKSRTVVLDSLPAGGAVTACTATGSETGPTGNGRAELYEQVLAVAVEDAQCIALVRDVSNVFTDGACYLSLTQGEGVINTATPSGSDYVIAIGAAYRPTFPAGTKVPRYVLFDRDGDNNATTAAIRPVTAYAPAYSAGADVTSVTYTGSAPPTGSVYVRVLFGDATTDTFKPDGFVSYRERLAAWSGNLIYFSGYPGNTDQVIEPVPTDWTYWYALNSVQVGNSSQGSIVRCLRVGDALMVWLEKAVYVITGYPPVDGGIDNQLVVSELSRNLGIDAYDSVCLSSDGQRAFFIGSDGLVYQANPGGIAEISGKVKDHERFRGLTHITASADYVVCSGTACDPSDVPLEDGGKPSGIQNQYPTVWVYSIELDGWTPVSQFTTDNTGRLVPISDPTRIGTAGTLTVSGRSLIAVGEPGAIRVWNDPESRVSPVADWYISGASTHQIEMAGPEMKRVDAVMVTADRVLTRRLAAASPVEDPNGALFARSIGEADSVYGATSRYQLNMPTGVPHNYISVGVGYNGERLIAGMSDWVSSMSSEVMTGVRRQLIQATGFVSRVDVLLSSITDCRVSIYDDDDGTLGDLVFYRDITAPQTGIVSGSDPYWHSFDMRVNRTGYFWVQVYGNATGYRYPSGGAINDGSGVVYNGYSMALRVVEEIGAPFVAKSILSIAADFDVLGQATW